MRNGVVDWAHTISSSLLNDLRLGLSYFPVSQAFQSDRTKPAAERSALRVRRVPSSGIGGQFGGVATIGNNLGAFNTFADTVIQIGDSLLKNARQSRISRGLPVQPLSRQFSLSRQ